MMEKEPLASIVISSYNYGRYLHDCIDSALSQSYSRTEVVVVDDASTDDSREIITGYGERIRPVLRERNMGGRATYNDSCRVSKGEVILILDSDDMLCPTAIESAVVLFQNPEVVKVHWPLWQIDEFGIKSGHLDPCPRLPSGDFRAEVVSRGPFGYAFPSTSGNAYARRFLEKVLPVPPGGPYGDAYLAAWALVSGAVRSPSEPQGYYRIHGRNNYGSSDFTARLERDMRHARICLAQIKEHYSARGIQIDEENWKGHSWHFRLNIAVENIKRVVPVGESLILVDEDIWATGGMLEGRRVLSFPESGGEFAGRPSTDLDAVQELEKQREAGAGFIVFIWQTFWWLDYYTGLRNYLRSRFPCILEDSECVIYKL